MKAVVRTRYGPPDVLGVTDVPVPVPGENEVLVKVHAASLSASDWEVLRGKPAYARISGLFRPRCHVLGSDVAGRVEAAGPGATLFRPGQDVLAAIPGYAVGLAEYACVPEGALARMPVGMTYPETAALPQAGLIAVQGIREAGQVQPGQQVLINGAGGGAGLTPCSSPSWPG
jgi:NADPH:quinone reductase-like Zn-dependent oxidoreductase